MIKTKNDLKEYLFADKIALGRKKKKPHFFDKIWRFQIALRHSEYYTNNRGGIFNKILKLFWYYNFKRLSLELGFSIPLNVCGKGLSIPHYGTIIINPKTKIGDFCRIHCSTNIGASAGKKEAPQIGNNCYIGPGAILFGDITIANNTTIGANATVNSSFQEENVVIVGTPARIVKREMPNWLEFNKVSM